MNESHGNLSAGKFRGLQTLADAGGRFKMVAVDQRPPLFGAIARHGERSVDEVRDEEVTAVKTILAAALAPHSSAILVDPVWGHQYALPFIPGSVGLISTLEDHAFEERAGERFSKPITGWSVAAIKRSGAGGVKLLAYHRPDLSAAASEHQDAFVAKVGEACRLHDIPFILELLVYPGVGEDPDSPEYAAAKPARVLASLGHFAQPRFGVDLFKLEFPVDLRYTEEFATGAFDGRRRRAVYRLAEVEARLVELDTACPVPWVLLSAGVGRREFALDVELAMEAGASGFLAGRAVWNHVLPSYPDIPLMRERLELESVPYLRSLAALADRGLPWTAHRRFGGTPVLEHGGPAWHLRYGE
jgi:tagatose 1,6-diphosphate aldolase